MRCNKPITIQKNLDRTAYPDGLQVPCGKCTACRIHKRKEWQVRLLHELHYWEKSMFLTLTYSNDNLPKNGSLIKTDLQKFIKRVRKSINHDPIKYYACGEYGDLTLRPHYHMILFGLGLNPEDKKIIIDNWHYTDWTVPSIRKNSFGIVEKDSIGYVTGYIDKKLDGFDAFTEYFMTGREPVFKIQSQGLGKRYVEEYSQKIIDEKSISMFGTKHALPRYYLNKLDMSETDLNELKQNAILNDCENVKRLTGRFDSSIDFYKKATPSQVKEWNERVLAERNQHDKNLKAKLNLKTKKL